MPIPDITEGLPALLSARAVSADSAATGALYDVVVSGLGFVFAIDSQDPYQRESIPVQKQQIDTSPEAGEQTLDGNWVRSQTSWHLGAGADYYEPGTREADVITRYRFKDSRGVDVWEKGVLSLHPSMVEAQDTSVTTAVCGARLPTGEDVWYSRLGDEVFRHHSGGITSHGTAGLPLTDGRMCAAGKMILAGGAFGVHKTDLTGATTTLLLNRGLGTGICQPYWLKGRVVTTAGPEVHENALVAGLIDATSLLYTHPDSDWTWSGVTEAPDAILAAGFSGGTSAIYAFVLTDGSTTVAPELTQPAVVAELPPGEEITAIQSYLGKYLGIGTTAGIRVAVLGQGGQVQYGPILVETADPVVSLGARDSFMYAATGSSVIRVNLDEAVDGELRFPYAYDVELADDITHLAFDGVSNRVVLAADGAGTYAASETVSVATGWLESGQIRYGTTAPKAFRTVDVESATDGASTVAVQVVANGATVPLVTLANGKSGLGISLGSLPVPLAQVAYRLVLNGGADTPVVQAVAVKAVPVPKRQRLIKYPVLIADKMRDAKNVPFGRDGYATLLLESLEALENAQAIVTVLDLTRPEQFEAVIERVEFTRVNPRARGGRDNFGGVGAITVRTL